MQVFLKNAPEEEKELARNVFRKLIFKGRRNVSDITFQCVTCGRASYLYVHVCLWVGRWVVVRIWVGGWVIGGSYELAGMLISICACSVPCCSRFSFSGDSVNVPCCSGGAV